MRTRAPAATPVGTAAIWVAMLTAICASACLDRDLQPLNPCLVQGFSETVNVSIVDKVDLLFVVDNSDSMEQEQEALAENFPRMVRILASGDIDPDDGQKDFPAVGDLHVGVVSTDMGTFGAFGGTCSGVGEDGVMQMEPRFSDCPDDPAGGEPFLAFEAGEGDAEELGNRFGCIAQLGTRGCGFEQQLEAPLKALTKSTAPLSFKTGSGHGDGKNAGFLRDDSLLGLILVTDEDDCSLRNPKLVSRDDPGRFGEVDNIGLRCDAAMRLQRANGDTVSFGQPIRPSPDSPIDQEGPLWPIKRYVDGFLRWRSDNPDRFVFGAITGVPKSLESGDADVTFRDILAAYEMQHKTHVVGGSDGGEFEERVPSCTSANGKAWPPRRIVKVAQVLEEKRESNGVITSICRQDFSAALDDIINKISEAIQGTCLPRKLTRDADGRVTCRVVERLPAEGPSSSCENIPGRTMIGTETDDAGRTHELCEVRQLPVTGNQAPTGQAGWYYVKRSDSFADLSDCAKDRPARVRYTASNEPRSGVTVRFECFETVDSASTEQCSVNSPCTCGDGQCTSDRFGAAAFQCDSQGTNTCQVACNSTADCIEQNLGGFVCDTRDPTQTVLGPPPAEFEGWCVAPTCRGAAWGG